MRVGLSTSVIQRGKSGVGQYVLALVRELIVRKSDLDLVLFVLQDDAPLFDFARGHAQIVAVHEKFRDPLKDILWHQVRLPALAREHALEVLHVPSYRRLLWPKPCPLVATIHDLAPFRLPGKYDWKRMFYGRVVARRLAGRQDQVIVVSESTARDVQEWFNVPRAKITVIHNGIDHSRFFPGDRRQAKAAVSARHRLNRPFFLYVARLEHPAKNHVRLVSAYEEFKAASRSDWLLALAGSDWHGANIIHETIRRSPVAADIRCLGFVPDAELPDLYRAAETFVYPSLFEGFGMPPTEAMACACPVISSTRGSLGEVVAEAAAIVDPEELHLIARELYRLATDAALRNRLRAAGLDQAQKFNWSKNAEETIKVYRKACNCITRPGVTVTR
jgi:glycosyltransferase involved in cell wall biosynthesis